MNYEPTTALNEGIRLLQANDFANAAIQLEQAVRQTPQDGRAHGYLGVAYARQGNAAASVQALQEAARLQPQDSGASYNLAVGLAQAQRQPEARAALEQALRIDPNNARARTALQSLAAAMPSPASPSAYTPANQPAYTPLYNSESAASLPASHYSAAPVQDQSGYAMPAVASLTGEPIAPAVMSLNGSPVAPLPADYQAPRLTQGMTPPAAYTPMGTPAPGMGGMQYMQQMRPMASSQPPDTGKRILRGLGWGAAFGQWWTLWMVFWELIVGGARHGMTPLVFVVCTVIFSVFFAVVGSVMGLIVGAVDAMPEAGAMIGVVVGLLLMAGEYFLSGSSGVMVNVIFWVFTSRFVGRNIAARVQQPVQG